MTTRLITEPTTEPVTLAEAKLHLAVDFDDKDALIAVLIKAARERCEHETGRAIMSQTFELTLDCFSDVIELLNPPVSSITSIKYIAAATGLETTLAANQYALDKDSEPARVTPAYGLSWPDTLAVENAVRIRYVAGYADAASVPESLKAWIKLMVGAMDKNRESEVVGVGSATTLGFADRLLDRYKVY